jgi:hypothetical protein
MNNKILLIVLLNLNFIFSQTKPKVSDEIKFNKFVTENTKTFILNSEKPIGEGWNILEKNFAENSFVAWGEYHNSALLSKLTTFALESASKNGFNNWCIETSPFIASELTRISKTKNPIDSILNISKKQPEYGVFPFFKSKEDAEMLITANKYKFDIWGVDQEYQMAFSYCINKVYDNQTIKIRNQYKPVRDSLLAKWWMPDIKLLDSLKKVISQKKYKSVLDDIKISSDIYYNNDNQKRASLMKKNFFDYYDSKNKNERKVFFKMGSNHLCKGINIMTHLYDLGNSVFELSERNKSNFTNVFFIVRYSTNESKIIDDLENSESDYPKEFLKLYVKDKWVVLDIKSLKESLRFDKSLSDYAYEIIEKYDLIVISPEIEK